MTAVTSTALTAGDRSFPWCGELPASWTTKPLKYLTRMNANTWGENTDPELLLRYVDIGSVNSDGEIGSTEDLLFENAPSRARRIVSDGDVLISTVRTYLRAIAFCEQASENLTCSTGFAVVTAGPAVDPKLLFYWARSSHFVDEIVSRSTGVSYPAINAAEIGNIPFPSISREEQQQIAAFLDRKTAELDAVLRLKERQLELLAEKRQALISQAVTRGLDPTAPLKPSGIPWLGDVPEHWAVAPLYSRYAVQLGKMLDASRITRKYLAPYLRNVDVQWDKVNVTDLPTMDFSEDDREKFSLRAGDLLVCEGGEVGRAALWQNEVEGCYYQKALHRLRPLSLREVPRFFYYVLSSAAYKGVFVAEGNLSTIDHLPAEKLRNHRFPFPPSDEQAATVVYLDRETARMDGIAQAIRTQIDRVREYRQALISAAVTGKIDVRGL